MALVFVLDIDDEHFYRGQDICIGGVIVAHRKWDGGSGVANEVNEAMAALLRDKLMEMYPDRYLSERPDDYE